MAMVPRRSAAMARRVTTYSLAADVVAGLLVGLLISSLLGWIVFVVGLIVTGFLYFNLRQVMRTRGMH